MTKKTIFYKEYDSESLVDLEEELTYGALQNEFFDDKIDKDGFIEGKFRVSVVWCSKDDCDCTGFQHHQDCPHHEICF